MTRLCMHVKVVLVVISVNFIVNVFIVCNPLTIFTTNIIRTTLSSCSGRRRPSGRADRQEHRSSSERPSSHLELCKCKNYAAYFEWSRYHVCLHFHPHLAHHYDEQQLTTNNNLMTRSSTPCTPRRGLPRWWQTSTCRTSDVLKILANISSLKTFPPQSNGFLIFDMCKSSDTLYRK